MIGYAKVSPDFWTKVQVGTEGECWPWLGAAVKRHGLVAIRDGKRKTTTTAHRAAYWLTHGTVDESLVVDHLCRNGLCCNPAHLEAVTQLENVRRGRLGQGGYIPRCRKSKSLDQAPLKSRKAELGLRA